MSDIDKQIEAVRTALLLDLDHADGDCCHYAGRPPCLEHRALASLSSLERTLKGQEAETARLRAALEEVAGWDSHTAERHGNIGVREFAFATLSQLEEE